VQNRAATQTPLLVNPEASQSAFAVIQAVIARSNATKRSSLYQESLDCFAGARNDTSRGLIRQRKRTSRKAAPQIHLDVKYKKTAGFSPAVPSFANLTFADQRKSCSTLCCDWLASASAETAID
jgi:hypothetical protein